jgi:hypothetical protein
VLVAVFLPTGHIDMKQKTSIITVFFWILAAPVALVGFAGLFTRSLKFKLPVISDTIIRGLDKYTVYGETLKGRAAIVRGEHWFFLITIGVVIVMAIMAFIIKMLLEEK